MFEKDEDYRKARKESKDRITKVIKFWSAREETLHDEGFQKGAEFGYNKANEWHYVKDGKYPKENQLVMVYRVNPLGANIAITNWYDSYKDTKVIAWKEIVPPELKEIKMTDKEEQIAFKQWCKDWGDNFKGMPKNALWQIYRSMDLENRKEFLEEAKRNERK